MIIDHIALLMLMQANFDLPVSTRHTVSVRHQTRFPRTSVGLLFLLYVLFQHPLPGIGISELSVCNVVVVVVMMVDGVSSGGL